MLKERRGERKDKRQNSAQNIFISDYVQSRINEFLRRVTDRKMEDNRRESR